MPDVLRCVAVPCEPCAKRHYMPHDAAVQRNVYGITFRRRQSLFSARIEQIPVVIESIVSARCNISRLCYDVSARLSVRLSVTEVHWRIIANLGFKFRSKFSAHCGRGEG